METGNLKEVHKKVVDLYQSLILPVIDEYFGNDNNATRVKAGGKYPKTLVSSADLRINELLTKNLPLIVPHSNIISEESEVSHFDKYTFIIDPIDGMHTFLRNLDEWGITIVLYREGEVIYTVIFYPHSKTEYYYAIKGLGAFDPKDKKVVPKKFFTFKPSFVCAPSSRKIGKALIDRTKDRMMSFRAYGSCVYALYTILRGGSDFIVFDDLTVWDILGCAFIAEQAGLAVHWFNGQPELNETDIKVKRYTLIIYKKDYNKTQIEEVKELINNCLGIN